MKNIALKFSSPDIAGESLDKETPQWIEINSWSHDIVQPKSAVASTTGAHSSGRAEHGEMIFTKDIDLASTALYQHCSSGTTFKNVEVRFYRASGEGKRVLYLTIQLQNALISRVSPSIKDEAMPVEQFSLVYAAVNWQYRQLKIDGTQGGNTQGAWSLTKNDKTFTV